MTKKHVIRVLDRAQQRFCRIRFETVAVFWGRGIKCLIRLFVIWRDPGSDRFLFPLSY